MTHKLRITFDGVVAVGPSEIKDGNPAQDGPLFAVMPRGNRQLSRWSKLYSDKPYYVPAHVPVMFTELQPLPHIPGLAIELVGQFRPGLEDAYRNLRRVEEVFSSTKGVTKKFNIWYPMRERWEFLFDEEVDSGTLTYEVRPSSQPSLCQGGGWEGPVYKGDIGAVADMSEIWPERQLLKKEMLARLAPAEVACQVFIPRGHVSSGNYGRQESRGKTASFLPKRTEVAVTKCLVPQIQVSVDVERFVQILTYSLDTGDKLDSISFEIGENADILIGNADHGDIHTVMNNVAIMGNSTHEELMEDKRSDYDFELYYPLFDGDDNGGGLPVPKSQDRTRFGDPHCYTVKTPGTT